MRTLVRIVPLALAISVLAAPARADEPGGAAPSAAPAAPGATSEVGEDGKIGVGGDLVTTLPLGDYWDATGPQIGASIRGGYYATPQIEPYVRVGYQYGFKKEPKLPATSTPASPVTVPKIGINDLSVLLGGRYFFVSPYAGIYGNVEIGMHVLSLSGYAKGDSITRFGANVGAGYVISKELPVNLGAQLSLVNLIGQESGETTFIGINILAGYEARF